jgi:hypothetical protein
MSFLTQVLDFISIRPLRRIGEIDAYVVVSENTNDTLTITKQPVQQGASITDHAYKEPTTFSTTALFKAGFSQPLSKLYQELLDLQVSREPFDIVTPKRIYRSMLLASLSQTTDKNTENCLAVNMSFQEVIIVTVSTTQVPRLKQRIPGATGATEKAGKKSALLSLKEGVGAIFQ